MKFTCLLLALIICFGVSTIYSDTHELPKQLILFAENVLAEFGKNSDIIREVKNQNRENISLSTIKDRDAQWRTTEDIDSFIFEKMSNRCAFILLNIENTYSFIVETFVMDNQGANVGQTGKTSDYWQGDEAKFIESFNYARGAIHYGDVEYDESVNEIITQISVPVMDGDRAIGAITFGVSLDRWERR